jgi:hypothetical protein
VYRLLGSLLALAVLSVAYAERPAIAGPSDRPMTITVLPRSESGLFGDTTLVYLDGPIDAGAADRLSGALDGLDGKIAVWLNSPGGNLFAGMQMGRTIRRHGAWTYIIDHRTLRPGECYSACGLTFLGGVYRFNDNAGRYGVHRASLTGDPASNEQGLQQHFNVAGDRKLSSRDGGRCSSARPVDEGSARSDVSAFPAAGEGSRGRQQREKATGVERRGALGRHAAHRSADDDRRIEQRLLLMR